MTNLKNNPESDTTVRGQLHPVLQSQFFHEGLQDAILDARCPRLVKFILKPVSILRSNWRLAPDLDTEQSQNRAYILPSLPARERPFVGQRLEIDRVARKAWLISYGDTLIQRNRLCLETLEIEEEFARVQARTFAFLKPPGGFEGKSESRFEATPVPPQRGRIPPQGGHLPPSRGDRRRV